jgi:hypothetical protein
MKEKFRNSKKCNEKIEIYKNNKKYHLIKTDKKKNSFY